MNSLSAQPLRLGQILVHASLITDDVLEEALALAARERQRLGEALVAMGVVGAEDVLKAVAAPQALPYLAADELPSTPPVLKELSPRYLRQAVACPIAVEGGTITVATADPVNPLLLDELQQSLPLAVRLCVAAAPAILDEDSLRVRYRIDGLLYDQEAPPRRLGAALTSRIKIMAELNIAERRLPQDGRIRVTGPAGRRVDIRVPTVPTIHGESIVMRLLDRSSVFLPFGRLGLAPAAARALEVPARASSTATTRRPSPPTRPCSSATPRTSTR